MRGLLFLSLILLAGCQTINFYSQGIVGQAEILWKSKPNKKLLDSPETPQSLKNRLLLAEELCRFLKEQQDAPGDANFSLVLFDDEYLVPHRSQPIGEVPPLDTNTYVPRSMTALLDAIGRTITGC